MNPDTEKELRSEIEAAQKVWSQRIEESDRARNAEQVARRDLERAARKYVSQLTKRN